MTAAAAAHISPALGRAAAVGRHPCPGCICSEMLHGAGTGAELLAHPCFLQGQEEFHPRAGLSQGLCSCPGSGGGLSLSACYRGQGGMCDSEALAPGSGGRLLAVTKAHV